MNRTLFYHQLLNVVGLAICTLDSSFKVSWANAEAARVLGLRLDDLVGLDLADFILASHQSLKDVCREVSQSGHPRTQLLIAFRGHLFDAEARAISFAMDEKHLALILREKSESNPAFARSLPFELISSSIPQLAWMVRPNGEIFWLNQRWLNYTGKTYVEMRDAGWNPVLRPDEAPQVERKWRIALHSNDEWQDTFHIRKHDGEWRRFASQAKACKEPDGSVLFWFGTNTDVEDQLRQQGELTKTQERLQLCVEAGELGTFHCPLPLGIIEWNAKFKEHFFLPPDAQIDIELFYQLIHPNDRARVNLAVSIAVAEGGGYDIQYRIVGPENQIRWLRAKGRTYHDHLGNPTRFDGVTLDITEDMRKVEERQALLLAEQSARMEAERANRVKDEFLAVLSHELRTPLSSVLGWAHILKSEQDVTEEISEGLQTIERNAKVQLRLIEDLLDISRITSGKLLLEIGKVNLVEIIQAAAKTLEVTAQSREIQIVQRLESDKDIEIEGDPARLQQVVWNLLSNAIKFAPSHTKVEICLTHSGTFVEISVTDEGPGIPETFLANIFDRFRQSDSSTTRQHGGLGLGLALARQLVELHGGSISAANRSEGSGAILTFTLPLGEACRPDSVSPFSSLGEGLPGKRQPVDSKLLEGLRVVSVDDDPDVRTLLKRMLENYGVEVLSATSAHEAYELLTQERPDVLLSDIGMPGEDGYTLIARVRSLPESRGGKTPAAALTAFARSEDRLKALQAGFNAHLCKPIDPVELLTILARLSGRTLEPDTNRGSVT